MLIQQCKSPIFLPARQVMLSSALVRTMHLAPPIVTSFNSFFTANPEPLMVTSVPIPEGPPGPDVGLMDVIFGGSM